METKPVELKLNDVDALIADLETDFAELRELAPNAAMPLTNNSCCGRASCHTF
ncbi:hypothetical protein ACFQY4_25360 [Catellatospora bangladeshensis]|uniref:Uncharacterized protein n=1 Tax=Catellatospora bangladeshensis TaxID=310355 RepID=A0A8J3JPI5_9ACTN|nr:hypothetical protein [Catellatospora bangladeshensis]GIF81559.1 hypothetical protein Cba03nite_29080 [Catellatospora bangladeshensis]